MALRTPQLRSKGVFVLRAPFAAAANVLYTVIAVRTFDDFVESGQRVFESVYQPMGLTEVEYLADRDAGASVVTLSSPNSPLIQVPNSYIDAYPGLDYVSYNRVILSVSLGALPDNLDLTFLRDQIQGVVSDVVGVVPVVKEHIAPSVGVVTVDEHDTLEIARQSAIANRTTDYAKLLILQNQVDQYRVQLANLESILQSSGLLPQ